MIFTPKFPLKFDDTYGYDNVDTPKQLIFFHLKNLLLTFPGEKISDPNFGVGIEKYLFEPFSDSLFNTIADTILDAIQKYLSYLSIIDIVVTGDDEAQTMNIKIIYYLGGGAPQTASFDVG